MLVSDFFYTLPDELIARYPVAERDSSRLMVVNRYVDKVSEAHFTDLPDYLNAGDVLVLNDTRVIPARLLGGRENGGKVELFLVQRNDSVSEQWICLVRPSKRVKEGQTIKFAGGMHATLISKVDNGSWLVKFNGKELFDNWLEREGHIPLPPYLQRDDDIYDRERYQTVFARNPGAVAAPTAGLHLTESLLKQIESKGVQVVSITLHTGLGTFLPVRVSRVEEHQIHTERYIVSKEAADAVNYAKSNGNRIIAVGTTAARTLEFVSDNNGRVVCGQGEANIFIYPGYNFKIVDALITNFHLPESTLLMLVSAFTGREKILEAYQKAIDGKFRFYSYGDAMLLV